MTPPVAGPAPPAIVYRQVFRFEPSLDALSLLSDVMIETKIHSFRSTCHRPHQPSERDQISVQSSPAALRAGGNVCLPSEREENSVFPKSRSKFPREVCGEPRDRLPKVLLLLPSPPVIVSVGNPLCPYGIAFRRAYRFPNSEVFKKSRCNTLCGMVHRVSSSLLGPVDPSLQALSRRLPTSHVQ